MANYDFRRDKKVQQFLVCFDKSGLFEQICLYMFIRTNSKILVSILFFKNALVLEPVNNFDAKNVLLGFEQKFPLFWFKF